MGLISRVSSRTCRRRKSVTLKKKMGNSKSKAAAASSSNASSSNPNFTQEQLASVGEGVQVGHFLLKKSELQAKEQELKNAASSMNKYVSDIAQDIQNQAQNQLTNVQKDAQSFIKQQAATIENLEDQLKLDQEKLSNLEAVKNEEMENVRAELGARVNNLQEILDKRGEEITAKYEEYFNKGRDIFPIKAHNPVCQESIASVLTCFRDNNGQSLNCGVEIDALKKCVDDMKREKGIIS